MKLRELLYKAIVIDSNNFAKKIYHKVLVSIKTTRKITQKYIEFTEKYNNDNECKYVMINWTPYGAEKETHLKSSFEEYIDVDFENIKAMAINDYDIVLTNVFGNYMTPPPIEKRKPLHNMDIYWKNDIIKEIKK